MAAGEPQGGLSDRGGHRGLTRVIKATIYSWHGLRSCFRHEAAFRQELSLLVVLAPLALWLGETGAERAVLVASLIVVPIVELLNSAVEATVDRMGEDFHSLAARAKDMGSAAVFLSLVNVATVWALVLL